MEFVLEGIELGVVGSGNERLRKRKTLSVSEVVQFVGFDGQIVTVEHQKTDETRHHQNYVDVERPLPFLVRQVSHHPSQTVPQKYSH